MGDYSWIGPLVSGVAKGINSYGTAQASNAQMQAAYDQMLANLRDRFGDYDKLGGAGYQSLTPAQLGPSALEGIQVDPQGRLAQQQALAGLSDMANKGGLTLGDTTALNQVEGRLNQADASRRQGLANEFAARGQLGSGAQLAMSLQGQQQAAQSANERGESAVANAQDRALQAVLDKGKLAGEMSNEDYRRQAEAARARDAIEARNAAARMDASRYNNEVRGRAFQDELAKAKGKTSLTNSMNEAVFGQGAQNARTTAALGGYRNDLLDQGNAAWSSWGNSGSSSSGGGGGGNTAGGGDSASHDDFSSADTSDGDHSDSYDEERAHD